MLQQRMLRVRMCRGDVCEQGMFTSQTILQRTVHARPCACTVRCRPTRTPTISRSARHMGRPCSPRLVRNVPQPRRRQRLRRCERCGAAGLRQQGKLHAQRLWPQLPLRRWQRYVRSARTRMRLAVRPGRGAAAPPARQAQWPPRVARLQAPGIKARRGTRRQHRQLLHHSREAVECTCVQHRGQGASRRRPSRGGGALRPTDTHAVRSVQHTVP